MNIDLSINTISENDKNLILSIFDVQEHDIRSFSTSTPSKVYSGNYIRVTEFRYWEEEQLEELNSKIAKFNSQSESSLMVLESVSDFEIDDDRYYEASFSFKFQNK